MALTEIEKQKIREEEEFRKSIRGENPGPKNPKNKLVSALLALLLGDIGIHKFYLGQTKTGVMYLLFCWTFIPALIGFFEGIGFLIMSEEKFQKKYSK